jgi:hypothetical protein
LEKRFTIIEISLQHKVSKINPGGTNMAKVSSLSRSITAFYVEWSALNHYLSSYECDRNGLPYVGFSDPRVQKLWKGLSAQERKEIMKRLGAKNEMELQNYFT